MANINEMRSTFVPPEEAKAQPDRDVVLDALDDVEDDYTFDDDDFWNALDLMETSYKMMRAMKAARMSPGRRRLWDNHLADLKIFTDQFPPPPIEMGD